jgi:hypothetical protein
MFTPLRTLLITLLAALLAACASAPPTASPSVDGWENIPIPGKRATRYSWAEKDGRPAFAAEADASASFWMKRLPGGPQPVHEVEFSWWVQDMLPNANVGVAERSDAVARVVFGFEGDIDALPLKTRMMFELAHALARDAVLVADLLQGDGLVGHEPLAKDRHVLAREGLFELAQKHELFVDGHMP